jgi:predicted ATP-dependent endonuclease of OLD family
MKISFVEIQNFRKLKACHIEFSEQNTIFVGANNSGKTSAMEALIRFLKERSKFAFTDFTISNWDAIEKIGASWTPGSNAPTDLANWSDFLPTLDIWFEAQYSELQYIYHLLPSLQWQPGKFGVRLRLQPKNIQTLYKDYREAIDDAVNLRATANGAKIKFLPSNLREFLEKEGNISKYFHIVTFLLDPSQIQSPQDSVAQPQSLPATAFEIQEDVLKGLVKIDIINAQRGLSDDNSSDALGDSSSTRNLSSQLKRYYKKHINPMDKPDAGDISAIQSIEKAQDDFDIKLNSGFQKAFGELQNLGYPGFSDPKLTLSSKLQPMETLDHGTALQYDVIQGGSAHLRLPERYNGLGYQNLVSMVFKLILFRDEWMRVGKLKKQASINTAIEPIHLVLVEEPEAHLHAQVQQVFINKAFAVLRNHSDLGNKQNFVTQMVVSTHSSCIAHECLFSDLRYFRRCPASQKGDVPKVNVVNLKEVFGLNDATNKFASRYLKTTHCDLFFADAAILVEGPAERILLPGLIKKKFNSLTSRYLTLLEIGGSHAHRLQPLIEHLGIPTLVITDLDAVDTGFPPKAVQPEPGKGYKSGNSTLNKWLPQKMLLDDLYAATDANKVSANGKVRVAYQTPFDVTLNKNTTKVYPYTFEDAVILENLDALKPMQATTGLLNKAIQFANSNNPISTSATNLFDTLKKGSRLKAEFALEVLCADENDTLQIPTYIREGLEWLEQQLKLSALNSAGLVSGGSNP